MSDSVRPHRRQPTRLPGPWDSPGKNTGVGCHFLLQCMKVKSESEVTQSCPTLSDPMDCSPPGSSVHGIFQQEYWSGLSLPLISMFPQYFYHSTICCPSKPNPSFFVLSLLNKYVALCVVWGSNIWKGQKRNMIVLSKETMKTS